ncbi:hypothetical protein VTO42DRAFT_5498 [Malbranchea cinnamomea]
MEQNAVSSADTSSLASLQTSKYRGAFETPSSFKLDEGYSDETKSQAENDDTNDVLELPEWLLGHSETARAELAYSLLRTLRTSTIAAVVDRLFPILHIDPVQKLPPEITAEIFSYLDPSTLLTASLASRAWRARILDTRLWRHLYLNEGWGANMVAAHYFERRAALTQSLSKKSRTRHSDADISQRKLKKRAIPVEHHLRRSPQDENGLGVDPERCAVVGSPDSDRHDAEGDHEMFDASDDYFVEDSFQERPHPERNTRKLAHLSSSSDIASDARPSGRPDWIKPTILTNSANGTPKLNWLFLYKQRLRLEENWKKGRFTNFQLPHPLYPAEGHRECVYAIQFSGKWLVSGSRDRTVRVWNLETRRLRGPPLIGHTKSVLCLQFDPSEEEDIIISGSSDRNVIIWRFSTGEKIHELREAHHDSVLNLRFDKRFLVTCSKDKLIKVWTRQQLLPTDRNYPSIYKGTGVKYPTYIVDTSSIPSPVLESQIANGQIRPLTPYSLLMTLDGHGAAVNAIQIGENEIISASGDRLIKVWELRNGRCRKTLIGHSKGIACVEFDGRRIVSGSNDDTVRIYDHATGAEVACLPGHQDLVRTVQAAFGDLPGADEAMKLEAMAVDKDFWKAQSQGDMDCHQPHHHHRTSSCDPHGTGSKLPKDITALGAQLPPGGGGSKWARILSGSYDETIIIWRKDSKGRWVIGQRLRQEEAANAASVVSISEAFAAAASNWDPHRGPMPGSWHPNSPASVPQGSIIQNVQNHHPPTGPHSQWAATANLGQHNSQQAHINTQPLNLPQTQHPGGNNPTHGAATHPQVNIPLNAVHPAIRMPHAGHHPIARVFKLQFDARKIICASQDTRIVGWDFACGDEDIEKASQFF